MPEEGKIYEDPSERVGKIELPKDEPTTFDYRKGFREAFVRIKRRYMKLGATEREATEVAEKEARRAAARAVRSNSC